MTVMSLEQEETWSPQIIDFLNTHHDLFLNWELGNENRPNAQEYDHTIYMLREVLHTDSMMRGYHCTRLTEYEIQQVLANGMQLPNQNFLYQRIEALNQAGLIDIQVSEYLKSKHEANDSYRAGRIWLCFYTPHLAGQRGIERFFRSWGGEALYNSHERDSVSGPILKRIGTPSIIEMYAPVSKLAELGRLDFNIIRRYLVKRGLQTLDSLDYEANVTQPIAPQDIIRIIQFPDAEFISLTKCDTWTPPLA
ncbi:MAG: hypothetical protein R3E39_21170 [Anaerolineae bacterium]